jgi:hypothetical protein
MSRYLRFTLIVATLLACASQPRAQVTINLSPPCSDVGILAWGQFNDGTASPGAFKSDCAGAIVLSNISKATNGDANQVAAFSAGRGVEFKESFDWTSSPLPMTFPTMKDLKLKVWVLYTSPSCDFACVKLKMDSFLVWANERLSVERTGIHLITDTDWVSDQTMPASTLPVQQFVAFSGGSTGDCASLRDPLLFPAGLKQDKTLNLYITKTVMGHNSYGISCTDPLEMDKFANSFVGWQATNSTMLHELSHNLGLIDSDGPTNVMNSGGRSFTEG